MLRLKLKTKHDIEYEYHVDGSGFGKILTNSPQKYLFLRAIELQQIVLEDKNSYVKFTELDGTETSFTNDDISDLFLEYGNFSFTMYDDKKKVRINSRILVGTQEFNFKLEAPGKVGELKLRQAILPSFAEVNIIKPSQYSLSSEIRTIS